MPPELRRAAIIEATLPLIQRHGTSVTTRQVAEAACVAEGTIFRVFDSLQELVEATIVSAFSPERLAAFLDGVTLGDTLDEMTATTLDLLSQRFDTVRSIMMAIHHAQGHPDESIKDALHERREELDTWLTERFADHAEELCVTPGEYVAFLRLLATGSLLHLETGLDPDTTASLALYGALRKERH